MRLSDFMAVQIHCNRLDIMQNQIREQLLMFQSTCALLLRGQP
jgi:hypothetical protein